MVKRYALTNISRFLAMGRNSETAIAPRLFVAENFSFIVQFYCHKMVTNYILKILDDPFKNCIFKYFILYPWSGTFKI